MINKERIWDIKNYDEYKAGCLAEELKISPLVTGILLERGLQDIASMREFLYGSTEPFHDPFLLKGMQKSVERIETALNNGEQITIYGDYDVDGITASSLLYIYLNQRGAKVYTYIPKRQSEGYGLNDEALKIIADSGTTLIITVDCGISGLHEVENAPDSLDIIITDHHTVPDVLPPAYAIVNAKQKDCNYPFKELSGVGIAFKLCQALEQQIPGQQPKWHELTELAALGTVADVVPLIGENREIVRLGLKAMETTELVGLQALMKVSGCPQKNIAADNIGFGLAPRLNAVGRLEHAQSAVELLVTKDADKADIIAENLNKENSLRQDISRRIMNEAEALLAQEQHIDTAIVLASDDWHQGVIGIVASRLVEKYHLPTVLLSISGDIAKGSCRSIPALNLYEAIAAESDLLTQFGGHHQAAGLTLPKKNIEEFKRRFRAYVAEKLKPEDYLPHQTVDCIVSGYQEISIQDLQQLSLLEPCGCANLPPVFAFHSALIHNIRTMGKERNHLQFTLDKGDFSYRCVMWNSVDLIPGIFENMVADVAFQPKINVWNNDVSVQLHTISIHQPITVYDFRYRDDDKLRLLLALLRTQESIDIYVNDKNRHPLLPLGLEKYVRFLKYDDLNHFTKLSEQAVFFDIPPLALHKNLKDLQQRGVKRVMLLFNQQEMETFYLSHPDRNIMTEAYRLLMSALEKCKKVSFKELKAAYVGQISEEAVKIMEQLGFISYNNDIIEKGVVKRCSLEDSPLYVELQQERARLEHIYKENIQLSQYRLLRS